MSEELTVCPATKEMLDKAKDEGISTAFDRSKANKACPFGASGVCCRNCAMGPCRLTFKGEVSEEEQESGSKRGVCGATAGTISARNFARMIASGASSHSDHGREIAETFLAAAKGEAPGYEIKDEEKLKMVARDLGISVEGKDKLAIAREVGEKAFAEFGSQHGEIEFIKRAPRKRQELWREHKMVPPGGG